MLDINRLNKKKLILACLVVISIFSLLLCMYKSMNCEKSPYQWSRYCVEIAKRDAASGNVEAMKGLFFHAGPKEWDEGVNWLVQAAKAGDRSSFELLIAQCGNSTFVTRKILFDLSGRFEYSGVDVDNMIERSGNRSCR